MLQYRFGRNRFYFQSAKLDSRSAAKLAMAVCTARQVFTQQAQRLQALLIFLETTHHAAKFTFMRSTKHPRVRLQAAGYLKPACMLYASGMDVQPFYENQSGTWSYLLVDSCSGQAAIIDPVWVYDPVSGCASREFTDAILSEAQDRGCQIEWVLETHAHADHLSSAGLIRQETGARVAVGGGICSVQAAFRKIYNLPDLQTDGSQFDRLLYEGDILRLGNLAVTVWETPGHTLDSVSYRAEDVLFVGDTLFTPKLGTARCDFPGGDAGQLYDSIQRIHGLPGETRLFLCHDYPDAEEAPRSMVTVTTSRRENIHVKTGTSREVYIKKRIRRDAGLGLPKLILPAVQVNVLGGQAPAPEDNGFSYLKIPFNTTLSNILEGSG